MMVLMRSLCKGSSTSLLPKSDVITLTALLKAAKAPDGCTIAESGMSYCVSEIIHCFGSVYCLIYLAVAIRGTHTHMHHFNGHYLGKPVLAS